MAQKTAVPSDGSRNKNSSDEKMSAEDQENFIKNLLIRCKSEMSDTNDGTLFLFFNTFGGIDFAFNK